MKFNKILFILMLIPFTSMAQVTFIASSIPSDTPPGESLYIAGNFTGWQPGSPDFVMHKNAQDKWEITLNAQPDGTIIKFKFTRGSWETVEKGTNGEEIPDRSFTYGNNDTILVNILRWAEGGVNQSTAAENVEVMDENFFMPQFNRTRRIWIYYPPDYETSGKNYPVLYMHDGQNLFDVLTSFSGEWEVDETLNELFEEGYTVPIVVGIDNGGIHRINEYTPWSNSEYGGGDGAKYLQFVVETLKPYIDENFRTIPGRESTGIMGSSLGGLISHFGMLQYPETFGKAGLFSPSYWFSDSVWNFTASAQTGEWLRVYQMCGSAEGSNTDVNMLRMNDSLIARGMPLSNIQNKVVPGGQHNEALWRGNFREAFLFLFDGNSFSVEEQAATLTLQLSPNPASTFFCINNQNIGSNDSLIISDLNGRSIITGRFQPNENIDIMQLKPGTYLVRLITNQATYEAKLIKSR
jgi:predicted alpha/beta superfamily hydrolase